MSDKRPLANVLTLGCRDLPRMRDFYGQLGWPVIYEHEDYVVFELRGAVLALFPREKLAADGRAQPQQITQGIGFTMTVIVDEPDGVDAFAQIVEKAGGRVTKQPVEAEFFVGRSAYFADPEENFWEIVWAPTDNPVIAVARRAAGISTL